MIKRFVKFIVVNLCSLQMSRLQLCRVFSKAPKEVIQSFDMVVGDEAHLFKATTLKGILEKMKTTSIRFGTTGTLDGSECHRLQLEGMFNQ